MELFEYIKSQLPQMPNSAIMKQMGASEELIDYVKETPWNTNLNVMGSITNPDGGGDTGEVWLIGDTGVEQGRMMVFALSNVDATDHLTELLENGSQYDIFANGTALPYLSSADDQNIWLDSEDFQQATVGVTISLYGGDPVGNARYLDASTAPTSVEVSVKAK